MSHINVIQFSSVTMLFPQCHVMHVLYTLHTMSGIFSMLLDKLQLQWNVKNEHTECIYAIIQFNEKRKIICLNCPSVLEPMSMCNSYHWLLILPDIESKYHSIHIMVDTLRSHCFHILSMQSSYNHLEDHTRPLNVYVRVHIYSKFSIILFMHYYE